MKNILYRLELSPTLLCWPIELFCNRTLWLTQSHALCAFCQILLVSSMMEEWKKVWFTKKISKQELAYPFWYPQELLFESKIKNLNVLSKWYFFKYMGMGFLRLRMSYRNSFLQNSLWRLSNEVVSFISRKYQLRKSRWKNQRELLT